MSDHLPECPCSQADGCWLISKETDRCISCECDRIRAIQQRIMDRVSVHLALHGFHPDDTDWVHQFRALA